MENISTGNITALDQGWSLIEAQESTVNVMISFIYSSFIHSSFNKHFCILLLCSKCCGGFGGLQISKIRHSLHSHGDYNLVQESGISQRIRPSHASLSVVTYSGPRLEEAL